MDQLFNAMTFAFAFTPISIGTASFVVRLRTCSRIRICFMCSYGSTEVCLHAFPFFCNICIRFRIRIRIRIHIHLCLQIYGCITVQSHAVPIFVAFTFAHCIPRTWNASRKQTHYISCFNVSCWSFTPLQHLTSYQDRY